MINLVFEVVVYSCMVVVTI